MLLSAGLLTLDIVEFHDRTFHSAGGTAGNVAAMAAWLGSPSAAAARVGADAAGAALEGDLMRLGVDVSVLFRDEGETMRIMHRIEAGAHRFSMVCVACHRRLPRHRRLTAAHVLHLDARESRFSALLVDRVTPALAALAARWARLGKTIAFEPWRRPADAVLVEMLAAANLVKISGTSNLEAALDACPRRPGGVDVVTLGADGLRWRIDGGAWRGLPAPVADVMDTAGAGDWLTATLLHVGGLRVSPDPRTLERHLTHAQAVSALSVGYPGALGLLRALSRDALDAVLAGRRAAPSWRDAEAPPVKAPSGGCPTCLRPLDF